MPSKPKATIERYGRLWPADMPELLCEFRMIQKGEECAVAEGRTMFQHYRRAQELLWPDDEHHRWSDLMLQEILANRIIPIIGPKDSGKTHVALARYGLTDYFCFPSCTLIIMSSTDMRGLELRVWGDLKNLYERAKALHPELPGYLVDSKHAICTDNIKDDAVRDMRRGIITIPCLSASGQYIGLGRYVGAKQKRRRLLADEMQFMTESFLDAIANLNSGDFKCVACGNPLGTGDPLDKISEPRNGWSSIPEPTKTTTWPNRFEGGLTINLVGTDSPNFDYPPEQPKQHSYMIGRKEVSDIEAFYGRNSLQYYSQALGIRKIGLRDNRVLTRELCEQFGAFDDVVWRGGGITRLYALDAGYEGDRCVGGAFEFGEDINKNIVLSALPATVVPIRPDPMKSAEDQIAEFCKTDCERLGIPPERLFYDSTGRGTLGNAFARVWSAYTNAIEFGGNPTPRPVASTLLIYDEKLRKQRFKRCDEHYDRFVSELWWSVRYLIESRQMRNLSPEACEEFSKRIWGYVRGDKISIEKKDEMKKRTNRSPDLADCVAIAVEGSRRLGLQITKIVNVAEAEKDNSWKADLADRARRLRKSYTLTHT